MANDHDEQLTLPGLELTSGVGTPSAMRLAVIETLEAIRADGLLERRHTALAQLCLELADAVDAGRRGGRASAAAMAAAQLLSALESLPQPQLIGATTKLDEWLQQLEQQG